jgi:hypothetical protein
VCKRGEILASVSEETPERTFRELMDAWVEAWVNYDRDAFLALMHPEVELYLPRSAIEGTVYRGLEGAARAFSDGAEIWRRFEPLAPWQELRSLGAWHLTVTRSRLHPHGPRPVVAFDACWMMKVEAGRIVYAQPFQHRDAALGAFAERAGASGPA